VNDANQAAARLATVVEQIDSLTRERSALAFDEALLARADDINRLHERRIRSKLEWRTSPNEEPNSQSRSRI
jgi:hypothetical protein